MEKDKKMIVYSLILIVLIIGTSYFLFKNNQSSVKPPAYNSSTPITNSSNVNQSVKDSIMENITMVDNFMYDNSIAFMNGTYNYSLAGNYSTPTINYNLNGSITKSYGGENASTTIRLVKGGSSESFLFLKNGKNYSMCVSEPNNDTCYILGEYSAYNETSNKSVNITGVLLEELNYSSSKAYISHKDNHTEGYADIVYYTGIKDTINLNYTNSSGLTKLNFDSTLYYYGQADHTDVNLFELGYTNTIYPVNTHGYKIDNVTNQNGSAYLLNVTYYETSRNESYEDILNGLTSILDVAAASSSS